MNSNRCGYYGIRGVVDKSAIKIKPLGIVELKENEKMKDTAYTVIQINNEINGYVFLCNISEHYLMANKKLPVMYVMLDYYKSLLKKQLFRVYLYFTITDEVTSEKHLLKDELKGYFSFELELEGKMVELDVSLEVFKGRKKVIEKFESILKDDDMKKIYTELIKIAEKSRKKMAGSYTQVNNPPKITFSVKDKVDEKIANNKDNK